MRALVIHLKIDFIFNFNASFSFFFLFIFGLFVFLSIWLLMKMMVPERVDLLNFTCRARTQTHTHTARPCTGTHVMSDPCQFSAMALAAVYQPTIEMHEMQSKQPKKKKKKTAEKSNCKERTKRTKYAKFSNCPHFNVRGIIAFGPTRSRDVHHNKHNSNWKYPS